MTNIPSSIFPSQGLCRRFSLAELQSATRDFDDGLVVGRGGSAKVYKGLIDGGATTVAVKRLTSKSKQGPNVFWIEIDTISRFRHKHLLTLLGYCHESHEMILVYEFMEQGTLANHLYKINTSHRNGDMTWEQRLKICIGAGRGLDYLHTGVQGGVIHRDVKTTNILLNKDLVAKISDFGLCKMGTASHSISLVSTKVKGTFGYLDPEYFFTGRLTKKSDVYAFGVVLLEVLCGRPAVDVSLEDEEQHSLSRWAQTCIEDGKLDEIIDPILRDHLPPSSLEEFAEVASRCLHPRPNERPTMTDVVVCLERALAYSQDYMDPFYFLVHRKRIKDSLTVQDKDDAFNVNGADCEEDKELNVGGAKDRQIDEIVRLDNDEDKQDEQSTSTTAGSEPYPNGLVLANPNLMIFSFSELKKATRNFTEDMLLGEGRYGKVYRGWLKDGMPLLNSIIANLAKKKEKKKERKNSIIAIKKLKPNTSQGLLEWQNGINFLGCLSHLNIVKLLGYCSKDDERLLVYEFMERGSLDKHLFGRGPAFQPLSFKMRPKILIGAARAIAFLHSLEKQVIYRDVNSSNILLDASYNAKMSDFGLVRLGPSTANSHVTTRVMGTFGYAAPEYIATGHLYAASDVYGFGVVILEMLTGLQVFDPNRPQGKQNLIEWTRPLLSSRREFKSIMDSHLEGNYPAEVAWEIAQLSLKCLQHERKRRPSMKDVVDTLERIENSN